MGLRDDAFLGAVKELDAIPLDGCPFLDETVFFHRPTGSLIGADVVNQRVRAGPLELALGRAAHRLL